MGDEDSSKDVVITYDTLFEILRKEKAREELQQLPSNFFSSLALYLKEKKEFIQKSRSGLFTEDESDKANKQFQNIIKIVRELYNRRERKIISIAINKAITGSDLIDTSQMLDEESSLFDGLINVMNFHRQNIINRVVNAEEPSIKLITRENSSATKQQLADESRENSQEQADSAEDEAEKAKDLKNITHSEEDSGLENPEKVRIAMLEDIPKFIGPNLEIYGPYKKDSEATISSSIAEILVESSKAKLIE